jgi:hypothetical protein
LKKSGAKNFHYAGPWALSPTTPMPSGAIPTVLRTAGTFSPSAPHNKVFLLLFVHKKKRFLSNAYGVVM